MDQASEIQVFEQTSQQYSLRAELRALLALAIPVVLSEIGWMTMTIVDLIMVGKLGPDAIGAVGLGNAVYYAPSLFGIGLLLGLDTLVSQSWGAGDYDGCHRSLAQGIYIALAVTPLLMLVVFGAEIVFTGHGVDPVVGSLTRAYTGVLNWSTLPLLLYGGFRRYLQGVGRVGPVTFALITANLVNVAGNWIFIYGKFGMPALGVRGSAISTCVARLYMAAVLIFAAWAHERKRGHALFAHWPGPDWKSIRSLLRLGLPAASQVVLEVAAFGAATVLSAHLTPIALATHEIVLSCAAYTYMVPLGVSAAAAVAVGHAVGAGNRAKARRAGWLAIGLGAGFMACTAVLFLAVPQPILKIWTHDRQVLTLGTHILAIVAGFQIFDGIQTVSTGALRGLGETRFPMLMNLTGYWILGLPLGALLCFRLRWGLSGLWSGLTFALITIALLLCARWRTDARSAAAA
ncbi:MATE family efflux transporter [Paracidobacterium acidisoli]|uniref:Multidrug-efflux transporter n=1 Tax=Paracidobacterium acidisoli TaxID=2303751 RepID=A0A372ISC9_9BACT|nr:MATE family efflux transporter [Paracidobacterium acidisoli]MBT9330589.1 MATE family efflux transporter [Paracidobacterium acidisoli]